jgi:type II secretory pathway component PulM
MRLSTREQWLVGAAVCFVALVVVGNYLVAPVVESARLLDRKVDQKRQELAAFADLESRLAALSGRYGHYEESSIRHPQGFSLFVELEGIARRSGIDHKIDSFKPQEHSVGDYREQSVDVELKGLTLEELLRFLRDIERSREALYVKRIEIAREVRPQAAGQERLKVKLAVGTLVGRVS